MTARTICDLKLNEDCTHATFRRGADNASGIPVLMVIRAAFDAGVNFEDLADGFGQGLGTMGGDWSGIRDSSTESTSKMFERAMNLMTFTDRR